MGFLTHTVHYTVFSLNSFAYLSHSVKVNLNCSLLGSGWTFWTLYNDYLVYDTSHLFSILLPVCFNKFSVHMVSVGISKLDPTELIILIVGPAKGQQ